MNKHHIARYWDKLDNEKIQCRLCPRECILKDQQRGFCFVRQNLNGELILTAYGRSSGFSIDPIEKKPLYHFHPGSSVLSFGTIGCNLGCQFCQNWQISQSEESDRLNTAAAPQKIAESAYNNACQSVAFTYNEPIIFAEYAMDVAQACHDKGIKTIAVTAGYINPKPRADFFNLMDAANVDLKAFNEDFYKKFANAHLQPVLETLIHIKHRTNAWLEITTLLIPGENDNPTEIEAMCDWIVKELGPDVPLHFSAFHPDFKMDQYPATSPETLLNAREIALSKGIHYVYTGNIYHSESGNTYCSNCGKTLIGRLRYKIKTYHIVKTNECFNCHTICSGHFDEKVDLGRIRPHR